jgi:hypothetical protein
MNKLEKLTAYLPYNVECLVDNEHYAVMRSVYSDGTSTFWDLVESEQGFESIKLLLSPIHEIDFTPYIEQNENDKVKLSDAVTDFIYRYESCPDNLLVEHFKSCPYCLMLWCLSENYDVFGMIADGEAIEIK